MVSFDTVKKFMCHKKNEQHCYICLEQTGTLLKLNCCHYVHQTCVETQIEQLSNRGELVSFRNGQCGICRQWIRDRRLSKRSNHLIHCVKKVYKQCSEDEECYRCFICHSLFLNDKPRCAVLETPAPDAVRCNKCKDACIRHGSKDLLYKCYCCCKLAQFKCGLVEYCEDCHTVQRSKPCVGSEGGCHTWHPPNGTVSYCYGCSACSTNMSVLLGKKCCFQNKQT
jgi:hypothetical protein